MALPSCVFARNIIMWPAGLVLVLCIHITAAGLMTRESPDDCYQLQVSIIVSSLNTDNLPRQLVLSWENASPTQGDWIGLFAADMIDNPLYVVFPDTPSGWVTTDVHETPTSSGDLGFVKRCVGYSVSYITAANVTLASSCLHTEPTWMSDIKAQLSASLVRQIFLPGSHDSGAYNALVAEDLLLKYTITQEEDILSQLINGIRYLDIRVGYYPNTDEKWYLNHGVVNICPLRDVLEDVQTFMENTDEIVILDFHEFPIGFGSGLDTHKQLVAYLIQELGQYATPPSLTWNATAGDVWATGKQLLLTYNNNDMVANSDVLWPAVNQQWGNAKSLEDLYTYLTQVMANPPAARGWAAMAVLTPSVLDIINDNYNGLRNMADMVDHNVTLWYQRDWGQSVNIVAVDYFRATGIVEAAIKWNKLRAQGITCNTSV